MNTKLTREELRAIGRIRANRLGLGLILWILVFAVIGDALFLVDAFGQGGSQVDVPEWLLIPFVLGVAALGAVIGIAYYMRGKLKDKEKAGFVRASIAALRSSGMITTRAEGKIFRDLAKDLISKSKTEVTRNLVSKGWPRIRARFFTGLVESLIVKCEWNINYEDQVAGFVQLLKSQGWSNGEIDNLVGPIVKNIEASGGRLTGTGITVSIFRNVLWIIIILVLAPILIWFLLNVEGLDAATKYDFIQILIVAVPALLALGFNIAAIIRKAGKRPGDDRRE